MSLVGTQRRARERRAVGPAGRLRGWVTSDYGAQAASIIAAILLWTLVAALFERIPGIPAVISVLGDEIADGVFFNVFGHTLQAFVLGVLLSVLIGTVLGILLGLSRFARLFVGDIVVVAVAVPGAIWALLCILWWGFAFQAPVAAIVFTTTPFLVVNISQGVQARSRDLGRMSKAFGVPLGRRIRHLVLPGVMDYVFPAVRFAIINGWNLVLLTEWFGGTEGVGHRTRYWYDANQFDGFVAWVVFFIAFIVLVDRLLVERIYRRVFRWRRQEPVT